MDALSRLLSLHPVRAGLDIRCRFGQPWHLPHPALPEGVAPYHFILEGRAQLQLAQGEPLALQAGDLVVLTRGAAHGIFTAPAAQAIAPRQGVTAAPVRLHVNDDQGAGAQPLSDFLCGQFHFEAPHSNALVQALPEVLLVRGAELPDGDGLRTLAALLRNECGGADGRGELRAGAQAVVAALAAALFGLAIRAWLAQGGPQPGLLALLAHPVLQEALQAMLEAPHEDWSLPRLAALCHMSRATFVRRFQEVGGATPGEVVQQLRMSQAARFLSYSKMSTAQIGEAVGYQSEAAFNRVFKKFSGMGPGAYRRKMRGAQAQQGAISE
ncbi:AraC family transcriptional regulator [Herbaspirillum rubrisubalbicans]|uniref:AraC family transcriptional regulator n=1 Tax=Herbaspirillum rubrisubalbicans TaxID=80842 RepID=A0ABX9BUY6_9BURK|nr:AraC family transcriptional regulator [Herbaspirillum rubrisubalbicans]MCP1575545.1 AraC family transcriptional activator of mtrCDE [Herbaspirillum rubrisubalbicans]RAM61543.1 AraC family transcriptional regulator [Herbaspirillum rubrisubalbicans]RAN42993.1 AraC family transcriptional regulator [Herbaspirillum rubrisubalbicans]